MDNPPIVQSLINLQKHLDTHRELGCPDCTSRYQKVVTEAENLLSQLKGTDDEKSRTILERAAMTCPVFLSLNTEIEKRITFNWK